MSEHWLIPRGLKRFPPCFKLKKKKKKKDGLGAARDGRVALQRGCAIRIMSSRTAVWRNAVVVFLALRPHPANSGAIAPAPPWLDRPAAPFRSWIIASGGHCATRCRINLMWLPTWWKGGGNEELWHVGVQNNASDCWRFHVGRKCGKAKMYLKKKKRKWPHSLTSQRGQFFLCLTGAWLVWAPTVG